MMLLDEPMAGLGQEDIERIAALIRSVAKDRTVLMVEHNMSGRRRAVRHHHGAGARARCWPKDRTPTVSRNPQVRRSLCRDGPWLTAAPESRRTCRPGTANRTCCTASSFEVGRGEVVTLLGRNGAGKTTTLKSIMGIVEQRTRLGDVRRPRDDRPAVRRDRAAGPRLLPGGARHLLEPQCRGEPAAAAPGAGRAA